MAQTKKKTVFFLLVQGCTAPEWIQGYRLFHWRSVIHGALTICLKEELFQPSGRNNEEEEHMVLFFKVMNKYLYRSLLLSYHWPEPSHKAFLSLWPCVHPEYLAPQKGQRMYTGDQILVSAIQIKSNVSFLTSFSLFLVEMNVKSYETIYQSTLKHEGTW